MMFFGRKKTESGPSDTGGAAKLANLLVVVDGSEPSVAAANFAVDLALHHQSVLTAVYVVDTATMDYLMQMQIFVKEEREEFEQELEATGKRYLDYVSTIGRNHDVEVETVLKRGRFHKTILQMARQMEVDAIVLGGWHRTVTRKDATSVERQLILDQADCPVIVVKRRPGDRAK